MPPNTTWKPTAPVADTGECLHEPSTPEKHNSLSMLESILTHFLKSCICIKILFTPSIKKKGIFDLLKGLKQHFCKCECSLLWAPMVRSRDEES